MADEYVKSFKVRKNDEDDPVVVKISTSILNKEIIKLADSDKIRELYVLDENNQVTGYRIHAATCGTANSAKNYDTSNGSIKTKFAEIDNNLNSKLDNPNKTSWEDDNLYGLNKSGEWNKIESGGGSEYTGGDNIKIDNNEISVSGTSPVVAGTGIKITAGDNIIIETSGVMLSSDGITKISTGTGSEEGVLYLLTE